MEEENTNTETTGAEETTPEAPAAEAPAADTGGGGGKRPAFLTVLCILTWVGSGIGLIMNLIGSAAVGVGSAMSEMGEGMAEGMGEASPEMAEAMEAANSAMANASTVLYIGYAGILLCVIGSILMFKLKKNGFYIYVVGELGPAIASMILLGGAFFGGGMMIMAMGLIFPILMTVLYGLNLKHMS